jgi:cytochrome b
VGHNPLGGWMVVVLLLVLLAQATTGLFANDDIFTEGPLAKFISKDRSDQLTSFHNRNPWLIYGLVALHVLAVIGHRVRFGEALVQAMLTGVKRLPAALAGEGIGPVPHARAVVLFAACAAAVWYVVTRL